MKVFASPTGCAVALAGHAITSDGRVDLLAAVRESVETARTVGEAALAVQRAFDVNADAVREDASADAVDVPPFSVPVLTGALIAGPGSVGPDLFVVALCTSGPAEMRLVGRPLYGHSFAPQASRADLDVALLAARDAGSADEADAVLGRAIRSAAVTNPGLVSLDWDVVVVSPTGTVGPLERPYTPPFPYPKGA